MKRLVYFGTTSNNSGHNAIGINFAMTQEETEKFNQLDGLFNSDKPLFFIWEVNGVEYVAFGVPYSPDDNRGGSKTIALVESQFGMREEIILAIKENEFLTERFSNVFKKYDLLKYTNLFLEYER